MMKNRSEGEEDNIVVILYPLDEDEIARYAEQADAEDFEAEFRESLSESDRLRDGMPDLDESTPALPDPDRRQEAIEAYRQMTPEERAVRESALRQAAAVFVAAARRRNRRAI